MIYIVVGKSCSGKTEARQFLQERLGLPGFEASAFFAKAMVQHKDCTPSELFRLLGEAFVAEEVGLCIPAHRGAIISGFRKPEEIEHIQELGEICVVGIYASDRTCYRRMISRGREIYPTFVDFYRKKLCPDYAMGLARVMAERTGAIIENEGDRVTELHESLTKLLEDQK